MADDHVNKALRENVEKAETASQIYNETKKMLSDEERKAILRGRELNGEPQDFNF
jgi:hypothetical protein